MRLERGKTIMKIRLMISLTSKNIYLAGVRSVSKYTAVECCVQETPLVFHCGFQVFLRACRRDNYLLVACKLFNLCCLYIFSLVLFEVDLLSITS